MVGSVLLSAEGGLGGCWGGGWGGGGRRGEGRVDRRGGSVVLRGRGKFDGGDLSFVHWDGANGESRKGGEGVHIYMLARNQRIMAPQGSGTVPIPCH